MKPRFTKQESRILIPVFTLWIVVSAVGLIQTDPPAIAADAHMILQPIEIPTEKLLPGLDVRIIEKFFRNINEMPEEAAFSKARPIRKLAYRYEGGTTMFDTDRSLAIGMSIRGYLHIEEPGSYEFQARSNDGIRVKIADKVIIEDPDVHSDRLSSIARCNIPKAGYLPMHLLYFQRKGSACLELYWKRPKAAAFEIVPETAFWRGKEP